jgi:hypothetical protein
MIEPIGSLIPNGPWDSVCASAIVLGILRFAASLKERDSPHLYAGLEPDDYPTD